MIAFDHLVIFSNNPERHAHLFSKLNQQVAIPGGKHDLWGTFNYLAFMKNDSYIEWLGIDDEKLASESDNPLIQHAYFAKQQHFEGPIQFALRVDDIEAYQKQMEEHEIAFKGPFPGKRTKEDGTTLEWKMLFPEYDLKGTPFPFLIEWNGEGNKPSNKNEINNNSFDVLTILTNEVEYYVKQLKNIYNLECSHIGNFIYETNVANGKLIIKEGQGLKAQFGKIVFQ